MKFTERIALEQFNYLEIEAESLNDLQQQSELAKHIYASRLHKPQGEASGGSTAPSKQDFPSGMQMQEKLCPKCGNPMKMRKGKFGNFYGCSKYPSCKGTRDESGKDTSK